MSEGNLEQSTFNFSALAASRDRPGGPGLSGLGPFARMCAEVHLLILFTIAVLSHSRINVPSSFQGLSPPLDVDGVVTRTQEIYKLGVEPWPLYVAPPGCVVVQSYVHGGHRKSQRCTLSCPPTPILYIGFNTALCCMRDPCWLGWATEVVGGDSFRSMRRRIKTRTCLQTADNNL